MTAASFPPAFSAVRQTECKVTHFFSNTQISPHFLDEKSADLSSYSLGCPTGRTRRTCLTRPTPILHAGAVHLLADAALLQKLLLLAFQKSSQHKRRLIDEGDAQVAVFFGIHPSGMSHGSGSESVAPQIFAQTQGSRMVFVPLD